jgi:hypothetical protein
VRPKLTLAQNLVEFGAAHFQAVPDARLRQCPCTRAANSLSVHIGIAQFLRLLASAVVHPGNRVDRQLARLACPGPFSERCLQSKLKKLNALHDRAAAT